MVDFDTSTPQLKAVKKMCDAYLSLDPDRVKPLLSKNYQYEAFPESTDFPQTTKGGHFQMWAKVFSSVNKHEAIYHEVIEAPGKVVVHMTLLFYTIFGAKLDYETIFTYTLIEEDGELKIAHAKDFANPQQRSALIAGTVKAAAEKAAA